MSSSSRKSRWGTDPALNALETIMWRAECDESLRSTVVSVEILDSTPAWPDVVAAHHKAVAAVPRLREHVVDAPVPLVHPRWSADPEFDLTLHLHRVQLAAGLSVDELLSAVEALAIEPFDRSRPLWQAFLFEGLAGGRAAYVLKLHHAMTDGNGIVQLLANLHNDPQLEPADSAVRDLTPFGALTADVRDSVRALPGLVGQFSKGARRLATTPRETIASTVRYGRSLQRVTAPLEAGPSPLLRGRSAQWRFAGLDVDLGQLRAAAKAGDATLNDAYVAALLGGYRRYHEANGHTVDAIPVSIPVSVRREGDSLGGNRFASARLAGPTGISDPMQRMRAVSDLVRDARQEPALDHLGILAPVLAMLPGSAIAALAGGMTKGNDLQASNVRGPSGSVTFAGSTVSRLYPFAPLPGCPAMITLVSIGSTCCVGINFDPAAFRDANLFIDCLVAGFREVLELSGNAPRVGRAR